jgi:Mce-associated membrane protein
VPPKGRTPSNPPRRRPRVAGLHQPPRPTTPTTPAAEPPTKPRRSTPAPADQTTTEPPVTQPATEPPVTETAAEPPVTEPAAEPAGWDAEERRASPAVIETPDFGTPDPEAPPITETEPLVDAYDQPDDEVPHADAYDDAEARHAEARHAEARHAKASDAEAHDAEAHDAGARDAEADRAVIELLGGGDADRRSAGIARFRRPQVDQAPDRALRSRWTRSLQAIALFVMIALVFGAAAVYFRGEAGRASTGSADNRALVDTAATTEVVGQVSKAIETVLSYDYTKLDDNERASREVITGKYADEFAKTFADVRRVSPDQKLTVTTTVLLAGVTSLSKDRAEVLATMDLDAVRDTTPYNSPGRVRVVANKVDGRWKIAEMYLL